MPLIGTVSGNPTRRYFRYSLSASVPSAISTWTDSTYRYVKWDSGTGSLNVLELPTDGTAEVECQVVGGGGGGGYAFAEQTTFGFFGGPGGGGAGGSITQATVSLNSLSSYAVSVGAGGQGADNTQGGTTAGVFPYTNSYPSESFPSTFSVISAAGGARGGNGFGYWRVDSYGYTASSNYTQLGSYGGSGAAYAVGGVGTISPLGTFSSYVDSYQGAPYDSAIFNALPPNSYFYQGDTVFIAYTSPTITWLGRYGSANYTQIVNLITGGGSGAGGNAPGGALGGPGYTLWDGTVASKGGQLGAASASDWSSPNVSATGYGSGGTGDNNADSTNSYTTNGVGGVVIVRWPLVIEGPN